MQEDTKDDIIYFHSHQPLFINDLFRTEFRKNRASKTRPYQVENNILMYRDILRFANLSPTSFKYTDLGNWLLKNNKEFRDELSAYSGSHSPQSRRLANKNHRITGRLEALIRLGLLYKGTIVPSNKNESLYTPTYHLTPSGRLITGLLEWWLTSRNNGLADESIRDSKLHEVERNILTVVEVFLQTKDSFLLTFIYAFFRKCVEKGFFGIVINYFLTKILKSKKIDDGQELLRLFLGLDNCINWIHADSEAFLQTINELDSKSRRMVLFRLKTEIEEYYEKHYLTQEWYMYKLVREITSNVAKTNPSLGLSPNEWFTYQNSPYKDRLMVGIPGKKWQEMRYDHCSEYTNLVLPGICTNCHKDEPFLINIFNYFDCMVSSKGPYPNDAVSGNCSNCGKMYSTGCRIIQMPFYASERDTLCPGQ